MKIQLRFETNPHIYFTPIAMSKINMLVDMAKLEVGWLGSITPMEDNPYAYLVNDIYIFDQTVRASETDMDDTGILKWFNERIEAEEDDLVNSIKFWGHSHVNMQVGPSGQDVKQIEELSSNSDVFIMGIFNKKHEVRLDLYTEDFIFREVDHSVHYTQDLSAIRDQLKTEFDDKVTEWEYSYYGNKNNGGAKGNIITTPPRGVKPIYGQHKGGLGGLRGDGIKDSDLFDEAGFDEPSDLGQRPGGIS